MVTEVNNCMFSKTFKVSIGIIIVLLVYAFVLSYFAPYDPMKWNTVPNDLPPSFQYLFGTTTLGQDVFWLCSFALRNSITFGAIVMIIATIIALLVGILAGYLRGKISTVLSIIIDSFCVIPALPIIVFFGLLWREHLTMITMGLFLSILGWSWPARTIRSMILSLRERMFIYTAQFSGYKISEIIVDEYLPYIFGLVLVNALNIMLWAIGMETTLAVFGLSSMGKATIGTIIFWAMNYQAILRGIWWWVTMPIVLLIVFIVATYLMSREIYIKMLGKR